MAGLLKLLDPIIAPAAKLYRAQLAKDLNKMGELGFRRNDEGMGISRSPFLGVGERKE